MLAKQMAIGLVISGLMTGAALAQSSNGQWRTSKVIGVNIYNDSNEKLGSIDELIMNKKDGKIEKVIIGVGGFLGVGQRDIAVNFDQLKFSDQPVPSSTASTTTSSSGSTTTGSSTTPSSTTGATSSSSRTTANEWYPDHAVMSATKDQLKSMPEFKYTESSSSTSTSK
jgi:sporulation protein YlmC with PRC-barrel domain